MAKFKPDASPVVGGTEKDGYDKQDEASHDVEQASLPSSLGKGDVLGLEHTDPVLNAKMHLVNNAIDEIGFTPYQAKLFCLNGRECTVGKGGVAFTEFPFQASAMLSTALSCSSSRLWLVKPSWNSNLALRKA